MHACTASGVSEIRLIVITRLQALHFLLVAQGDRIQRLVAHGPRALVCCGGVAAVGRCDSNHQPLVACWCGGCHCTGRRAGWAVGAAVRRWWLATMHQPATGTLRCHGCWSPCTCPHRPPAHCGCCWQPLQPSMQPRSTSLWSGPFHGQTAALHALCGDETTAKFVYRMYTR